MAFSCERVPDPDAAPSCFGDDHGTGCGCGCGCDSTTTDPGIRLIAGQSGGLPSGGQPRMAFGGNKSPVDTATGLADVSIQGLSSGAVGPGVSLRYSNGIKSGSQFVNIQMGVGYDWSLNLLGRVLHLGNNKYVAFFQPTNRGKKFYFTKESDGSFTPLYACKAELVATSTEYWLMVDGVKVVYYKTGGGIKKIIGSGGIQTDFVYDVNDRLEEVVTTRTVGSDYYKNSLLLAYQATSGGGGGPGGPGGPGGASVPGIRSGASVIVESITERSYVGTNANPSDADYTPMARLELEIPDTAVSNRCPAGNLYRVKRQKPTVSGGTTTWSTEGAQMLIYATSSSTTHFAGALKYVIDESGYASLSNPDTATDTQLKAASTAYYEYDPTTRMVEKVATHGGDYESTIAYTENTSTPADPTNNWRLKSVYTANDGSQKTIYSNHNFQDMLVIDDDGTDQWIYYTVFDSEGRILEEYTPASIDMSGSPYDDTQNDLDVQINASAGRINITNWYTTTGSGGAEGRLESHAIKEGSTGTEILLSKVEYGSRTITDSGIDRTVFAVTKTIVYQSESGGGDPVETSYAYTWHAGTLMPATVTTTLPDVATADNGVAFPQTDTIVDEFNTTGQLTKRTDAMGVVTEFDYDPATGAQIQIIQDSGTGKLNLTTDHEVNATGRITKTMGPEHDVDGTTIQSVNWSVKVSDLETWSAQGCYDVSADSYTLINPVSISKRSADGTTVDQIQATRGSSVESAGELSAADSFPKSSWVSWSQGLFDIHGRRISSRNYFDIPSSGSGTKGTNYLETSVDHDNMGRENKQVAAEGTISRTVFNSRGLPVANWIGTDDTGATDADPSGGGASGNNMVQLQAVQYDGNAEGGNGLRTKVTSMVNASTADNRVTEMEYDWRDRLVNTITTDGVDEFHQKPTLDNLGRATAMKTYRNDSSTLVLVAQSESFFDDRGRNFRNKNYAVSDSGVAGNALEANQWYDANGRVIKSSSPGSQAFTKTVYDAVGRSTTVYSAYYDGLGTDDPESIASNVVLTQQETEYNAAGQAILMTSRDRLHDSTGDGALNGPSGSQPKSRDSYAAMWYDEMGRQKAVANYGTAGGTAPTRPSSAPTSSDTVLVSSTDFDIVGRAYQSTDPAGAITRTEFDDAGRTTKVIHNFGGSDTQTIRTEYNSVGQQFKLIAENADTGNQETTYSYGVTIGTGSAMNNNALLAQVTDPESGTVTYDYDRTGQQISLTDANGTVHDYQYDAAGRRVADLVSTLGSGVDGAVRRIEHSYDNRMRLQTVTTFDAVTGGNVESEIQYQYDDFGQIVKEYQQHSTAVNLATSPVVEYNREDGGSNTIRIKSMTYPNGRQLDFDYGTSGSEPDLLDRIIAVKDGTTSLVTYEHSGSGSLVTQTYNEPGIEKTLALGSGADPYSAMDRFGRMIDLRWSKGANQLVHLQYDYDRVSNRLFERNKVLGAGGSNPAVDNLFQFDQLNRMKDFQSGELNTAGDAIAAPELQQSLTLDETGNFKAVVVQENGSTVLNQARSHNDVNEITDIIETVGSAWATPTHDTAGNMTAIPKPSDLTASYDATWDAWHRLVSLKQGATTVAGYQYDGNGRRMVKEIYSAGSLDETRHVYYSTQSQAIEERVDSSTDAEIQFVWNLGYVDDLLLRDRDTSANGVLDERLYSLPDLRYCVMALADSSGAVVERYTYDAHGKALVMSPLFGARTSSNYDWEFRYTGRREDLETGLMYFRARYFSNDLGRFASRDPLGFVDGVSQYRAYFTPAGLDPTGAFQAVNKFYPVDFVGPLTTGGIRGKRACRCSIPLQSGFNKVVVRYTRGPCSWLETVGLGTGRSSRCTEIKNPAPETYAQCMAKCKAELWNITKNRCKNICNHRYRNRLNMCPSKKPTAGVPDSKGNTWSQDGPAGQFYHPDLDCFRSGNFQCCYDCEGDVVTRGPNQGTYDYAPPTDWHDHYFNDMDPHHWDKNYFDDLTTIY